MRAQMSSDQLSKIESRLRSVIGMQQAIRKAGNLSTSLELISLIGDMIDFYRRNWKLNMDWAYGLLLKSLESPADLLAATARNIHDRGCPEAALHLAETAARMDNAVRYQTYLAEFMRRAGHINDARNLCNSFLNLHSENNEFMSELFMCDVAERFWSHDYYEHFSTIQRKWKPNVYLEIGVATGKSLALAGVGTRALGIDPGLTDDVGHIFHSPCAPPQLYCMTSDDFFDSADVEKEMGQSFFNVAFIDGLHHFDQALRDFINLEKYAEKDSVILIHDCLPVNPLVATRERSTAFWTGDVWKIIPCLKTVRPDLEVVTLPAPPAGLALVRGLDRSSRVLARHYNGIVERFDALELPESWAERCELLSVESDEAAFRLEDYFPPGDRS